MNLTNQELMEPFLRAIDLTYYEVKEAFGGLSDANVWKRPTAGLLSVGELAGHIAFWQAIKFASEGGENYAADISKCKVVSPLIDPRFRYYTTTIDSSPSAEHLAMTAEQVYGELVRVHEESLAHFKAFNPNLQSVVEGYPYQFTYEDMLKYNIFHVSYHVGQIYSVRHLLGEQTPDN